MRRYWLRIGLGALAIFAGGMVLISLVHESIDGTRALIASSRPISIPLAILPFRLEGEQVGEVKRLELLRKEPRKVSGVRLQVTLGDSALAERVRHCALAFGDSGAERERLSFWCSSSSDSARRHLVPFGEVVFEPSGIVRAVLVPSSTARQWRSGLDVDSGTAMGQLVAAEALFRADSDRAVLDIRADSGESLVHLDADSHGARLHVRDRSGRDVLSLHADSSGASLEVRGDSSSGRSRARRR